MSQVKLGISQIASSISDIPNWNVDYNPNPTWDIPNRTWDMVRFDASGIPNLTMSQIFLGEIGTWISLELYIPNSSIFQIVLVKFGTWSGMGHPMLQT